MSQKVINTPHAPKAIGPYVQARVVNNLLFTSGQIPLDPDTGEMVEGDIDVQTKRVLDNLDAVIKAGGCSRQDVVKCTIFLAHMRDFARVNEKYAEYFDQHKPARSCVEVACLPKNAQIEIECIALVP